MDVFGWLRVRSTSDRSDILNWLVADGKWRCSIGQRYSWGMAEDEKTARLPQHPEREWWLCRVDGSDGCVPLVGFQGGLAEGWKPIGIY